MNDFLRALAECLKNLPGEEYPLYYGRILQGAEKPCLVLVPPSVSRQRLSGGRVRREYGVNLRFYPTGADMCEQQEMGEKLICALDELLGERMNYRGREMKYEPGEKYLLVSARYEVIIPLSLEQQEESAVERNVMQEFGFILSAEQA